MFSEEIKEALSRDVAGQPRAVESVVRGLTRLSSGLTPLERSWCAYLFIGPPGTGRAHLVRTLARILHGSETLFTLNCNPGVHSDWWAWLVEQLAPFFGSHDLDLAAGTPPRPRILLVRDLECAPKGLYATLASFLETGELALPRGRRGRLGNSLVFLTTGLCTAHILDTARLGFPGSAPPSTTVVNGGSDDPLFASCMAEAEKTFGLDLLAQIDDVVLFRRLEPEHLGGVLDRHFARMCRWLAERGIHVRMEPSARDFLLSTGDRRPWRGARDLIVAHRHQMEFPLADLLVSGRLRPGGEVVVERRGAEPHLHFVLSGVEAAAPEAPRAIEVPVG